MLKYCLFDGNIECFIAGFFFIRENGIKGKKYIDFFFVNIGPKLAKDIEETEGSIFDTMNNPLKGSFFLEHVTIHEVLKIVNASPNKTSMDHSGINFALLKESISFIVKPVCHIANSSFEMGIFPKRMKIAKVIPIFKSGKKDSFTNYRPASLLPQFSKILEKLFNPLNTRLLCYCPVSGTRLFCDVMVISCNQTRRSPGLVSE